MPWTDADAIAPPPTNGPPEPGFALEGALLFLFALVLGVRVVAVFDLGLTAEEALWDGVFGRIRATDGWCGLWTQPAGSFRPLCASLLELESGLELSVTTLHTISLTSHVACLALLASLVARVSGRRAGWLALALAGVFSPAGEVTNWLGARCELLWVFFALLASHATLSGERCAPSQRWRWSAGAALAAIASAAAKESAFLLPLLLWPLVSSPRQRNRTLRWVAVALVLAFAVRWFVLGDPLGPYVERNLAGPTHAARQVARAGFLLVFGDAVPLSIWLLVAAATVLALVGLTLLFVGRRFEIAVGPWAVALAGALLPSLARSAPRTMYAPMLVAAAGLAVVAARRRPSARVLSVVVLLLATGHAVGSVISVQDWKLAYGERERASLAVARIARDAEVFLVAPRETFHGRHLGYPFEFERDPRVHPLCRAPSDPFAAHDAVAGDAVVGHAVRRSERGPCSVRLTPIGFRCTSIRLPDWIRLEGGTLSVDRARQPRGTQLAFVDETGSLELVQGGCSPER